MNFVNATLTLVVILFFAMASEETWARGRGGGGGRSSGGHHSTGSHHHSSGSHSHVRSQGLGLYPYGYSSTPAYSNRYKPSCSMNPELEECVREREQVLPLPSSNASG